MVAPRTLLSRTKAQRDLVEKRLKVAEPKETAALSRELRALNLEVDRLERLQPKKSVVDELGRARTARRAKSPEGGASAGGGG